jgi:RNA polymerase sigma factor (sigma-70 family)
MEIQACMKHGLLGRTEERRLIRSAQHGDIAARNRIIQHNVTLVISRAGYFFRPGSFMEIDDLIQCGCLGLMKAVKKFDLARKAAFSTYAGYWIDHEMRRNIERYNRTVALPSQVIWLGHALAKHQTMGIPERNGPLPMTKKEEAALYEVNRRTVPIEIVLEDGTIDLRPGLIDEKSDPGQQFHEREMPTRFRNLFHLLPGRERKILEEYYGTHVGAAPKNLTEIAKQLEISRERVRQIKERALKRLQKEAGLETTCSLARIPRKIWDMAARYKNRPEQPDSILQPTACLNDSI